MAKLILIRHGESEWNAKGLWTGWTDIGLSEKGKSEAKVIAGAIRPFRIDVCFTSELKRAQQTLSIILSELGTNNVSVMKSKALNERNYGDYTGKNKWELQKILGDEAFHKIRRGWDVPIPNGETLKDVAGRVYPYYKSQIHPLLMEGKNILIAAHGNSIRALMKELEGIPDDSIALTEVATGEAVIYTFDNSGKVVNKERIKADTPS